MRGFDLAFSPGGNLLGSLLETASEDHHVMPRELASAGTHWTLHGHLAPSTRVIFGPEGLVLASASVEQDLTGGAHPWYHPAQSNSPESTLIQRGGGTGPVKPRQPTR
jgi:hypothetical protein